MKQLMLVLLLGYTLPASAQHEGDYWYFADHLGLHFSNGTVTLLTDVPLQPLPATNLEGTATISDKDGNLLFYSDGMRVWNRLHTLMPNGIGLAGEMSATQPVAILPTPGNPDQYYLFTNSSFVNEFADGLNYSVVDMCLNKGKGDVVADRKNIHLLDTSSEKLAVIRHADGIDYWLVATKHYTNEYYAYRVSAAGIAPPVVSLVGPVHGDKPEHAVGQMKASPDGLHLAWVDGNQFQFPVDVAVLLRFDPASGSVSAPVVLQPAHGRLYGVSFSPGSNRLYTSSAVSAGEVDVFDITSGDEALINASMQAIPLNTVLGMQLGPDGRLYFSHVENTDTAIGPYIGVIEQPDAPYPACTVVPNFLAAGAPGTYFYSFPTFLDSYRYGGTVPTCGRPPVDTPGVDPSSCRWQLPSAFTPNSDSRNDRFRPMGGGMPQDFLLAVFDRWGAEVYRATDPNADGWDGRLRGVPAGVGTYFWYLRYRCADGRLTEERGDVQLLR